MGLIFVDAKERWMTVSELAVAQGFQSQPGFAAGPDCVGLRFRHTAGSERLHKQLRPAQAVPRSARPTRVWPVTR